MIKYDINKYEEFFSSIIMMKPVYIGKLIGHYPIPYLEGFVYPFLKDGKINILTSIFDDNKHMSREQFQRIIINCKPSEDLMVKLFELGDALRIYDQFKSLKYVLYILDDTFDKYIENNN